MRKRKESLRTVLLWMMVLVMVGTSASGAVYLPEERSSASDEIICNVKFSKPAICCDVGEEISLTDCGVQFSPFEGMVYRDITWKDGEEKVKSFTPAAPGVYPLTASADGMTKTVYIVAKAPEETDYLIYANYFDAVPEDFRIEAAGEMTVENGSLILQPDANGQIRVLLPEFLDAFGDVTVSASVKVQGKQETSLLFRGQKTGEGYLAQLHGECADKGALVLKKADGTSDSCGNTVCTNAYEDDYNLLTVTAKGTYSTFSVNSRQMLEYCNTAYATGSLGMETHGSELAVDYVRVVLDGNDPILTTCDVSYGKPALRADIGDTLDLKNCKVQFEADTLYTEASEITWYADGKEIKTFTPAAPGVTELTALWGDISKRIFVVTRDLTEGEYVLYRNDFDAKADALRPVQRSGALTYCDGDGHYVMDASSMATSCTRVYLPEFLDEFRNFHLEAACQQTQPADGNSWASFGVYAENQGTLYVRGSADAAPKVQARSASAQSNSDEAEYDTFTLTVQNNEVTGEINGDTVLSYTEHGEIQGGISMQTQGQKLAVDYVQVTLGATTAAMDTSASCYVAKSRPAIGCNVGETVRLNQCAVQFSYGAYPVSGDQITWKKDGRVITSYSNTTEGIHTLTATHGHTTMEVHVVVKKSTSGEYVVYNNEFNTSPTDYRVPETSGGGRVYPLSGTFVLNGSAAADAYVRVLLPVFLDQFGDLDLEASMKLSEPVDNSKWGSVMYRVQNSNFPYMQCCLRYNANTANGVEISQRTADNTWSVLNKGSTTKHASGGYNVVKVSASNVNTSFYINGTQVLTCANTSFSRGCWGFQVRGLTMTLDYVRLGFRSNYTASTLYTVPGGMADVRDPSTGISTAPALITEVKTAADLENILNGSPAIAIMNYDVVSGSGRIVFSDGYTTPDAAITKLGSKVIPAFRVGDTTDVDSLVSFLKGKNLRDAFVISSELSLLKRAYNGWKYLRGVADYSAYGSFDPETIRYNALANGARVLILPESTPRDTVTKLQDSYACVWLPVGEGKTASVAGTNKGPYGLITPDRATTEYCYQNYYGANTLIRKTNIIGHRGVLSLMPENTILGTQTAYQNGANMVENDIYLTADGVVVVMHDQTIDRTTNGSGQVVNMTSNQLKQYKVDYHSAAAPQPIPTLEDYFKLIKGQAGQKLVIEMKHPYDARLANSMVSMIKKYDILDQVVIMSFIQQNIANTTAALPGAPVGWLNRLALDESNPLKVTSDILENIQPYNSVFNPEYLGWGNSVIKDQAYRGITLWPWTVNKHDQFDKLFIDGIAGITTDYCQWGKNYIESIHWNSASRVISSTYQDVLTDVTNSCEIVLIEDTLGVTCSAGNIIVPQKPEGGKVSFYYRYKSTTATGAAYYTVTEIRTVVVPSTYTLTLKSSSSLKMSGSYLTKVTDGYTANSLASQFQYPVEVLDASGAVMSNYTRVGTGCVVRLKADPTKQVTVILRGDADGDGRLNGTDYLLLKSCFLKQSELTGPYLEAADCNDDGKLDCTDYLMIKAHFLGKVNIFS